MNRRELLKNGLLAGTLSIVPFSNAFANTAKRELKLENDLSGFKKSKIR